MTGLLSFAQKKIVFAPPLPPLTAENKPGSQSPVPGSWSGSRSRSRVPVRLRITGPGPRVPESYSLLCPPSDKLNSTYEQIRTPLRLSIQREPTICHLFQEIRCQSTRGLGSSYKLFLFIEGNSACLEIIFRTFWHPPFINNEVSKPF